MQQLLQKINVENLNKLNRSLKKRMEKDSKEGLRYGHFGRSGKILFLVAKPSNWSKSYFFLNFGFLTYRFDHFLYIRAEAIRCFDSLYVLGS